MLSNTPSTCFYEYEQTAQPEPNHDLLVPHHAKPRGQQCRGMGALAPELQEGLPTVAKVVCKGFQYVHLSADADDAVHTDTMEHFRDQRGASLHELFLRPLSSATAQTL